jgi:hypothetical protein
VLDQCDLVPTLALRSVEPFDAPQLMVGEQDGT